MKQWRKLAVVALLAWLLLFLSLLSRFLDLRADIMPRTHTAARAHSLTRTEIRRLASIQGGKGASTSSSSPRNQGSTWGEHRAGPPGLGLEGPQGDPLNGDTQDTVAWSFLREGPAVRDARQDGNLLARFPKEALEERRRRKRLRIRRRRARRRNADGSLAEQAYDPEDEDYFVSRSKAVVQRLWKGNASAGMLSPRLQKALRDYLSSNKHHVAYRGLRRARQDGRGVLCELKKARLRTLDGAEEPFASLGWAKLVPSRPLEQLQGSEFKTCAVVTSAGAILNSSLGREIDSHDAVLRFNAAPTEGYEKDVGNKTTIRIINSQIVARPRHHFNSSSLYQDVTLVAWDPAPYSVDLSKWYENPDYDLFTPYSEPRRRRPDQPFYILHPGFIWQLWDVIQANTQENIQPNPPSSGFIGILLMMSLCREVNVYEYIPSVRQTDLCHYHERYYDAACTLGAYHPLLYEKLLVQRLNAGAEQDLRRKGRVTLRGFATTDCGS